MLSNNNKIGPFVFVSDNTFALADDLLRSYSQTGLTLNQKIVM